MAIRDYLFKTGLILRPLYTGFSGAFNVRSEDISLDLFFPVPETEAKVRSRAPLARSLIAHNYVGVAPKITSADRGPAAAASVRPSVATAFRSATRRSDKMAVADKKLRRSGELRTEFALYRKNQSKPHARSERQKRGKEEEEREGRFNNPFVSPFFFFSFFFPS